MCANTCMGWVRDAKLAANKESGTQNLQPNPRSVVRGEKVGFLSVDVLQHYQPQRHASLPPRDPAPRISHPVLPASFTDNRCTCNEFTHEWKTFELSPRKRSTRKETNQALWRFVPLESCLRFTGYRSFLCLSFGPCHCATAG